ncbi:putative secreted protein (Por secretion system target) [Gillisia sp. Hel_I_86]|uniref:Ig-like domain-containing protein n=1 Tax=Gillisia sp. Hel_I_86 TaxID=1249981 RepID=UPI0011999715|nr:LamG-like jellyroll fold domain-containing protein [Gillisia sp. Hel_I_86]TVZ27340.1 putative secreted protein (Por secretion system target) [Gillisia sp. Hel_I_86]
MGKKLPFLFVLLIAHLSPTSVMAQCPTSVSISAAPGTTICAGTSVTFTATPNSGSNWTYEWLIGNTSQSTTGNTFTSSTLGNSDKIKVIVTSVDGASCNTNNNLTMTVNPMLTPSVSISASKTTICPGENVVFTAAPINGGSSPSYIWKIGSTVQNSTSNTFSTTALTDGQSVTVQLTSNATCATLTTATSSPISITVKPGTPATPEIISGQAEVCPSISSLTYSISPVANATSYEWTLPVGWSGNSTNTTINATSGTTGSGTISVKAKNDCGTSAAQTSAVNVLNGTPNVPKTISGMANLCPGANETYSIATVSGATEYEWTLPNGWAGTSITNTIDVTAGAPGNGNITVKAKNSCGTSAAKTMAVSLKPATPAVPIAISGTVDICPGTTNTYSIAAVANATSYEWTLPNGWTGTSTSTSINATSNTSGGNITVKSINDCGTSTEQTLAITIKPGTPATPSAISGSNTVCPNTSETYSVTNDATASEYIWTLPNGWTGTSTTSSITINTGNSGSGNITVKAKNDCGTSSAATIAVSVKAPAPVMSGTISGPALICAGSGGLIYSIPAITNATSYTWTLPNGWSGTSTSNSITATAGSSGNISVIAKNSCGDSSASQNFNVQSTSGIPATPGLITTSLGDNEKICPPYSNISFNVPSVANATSYNWILPSGWEITAGMNTNNIIVRVNATDASSSTVSIAVEATNICGKSGQSVKTGIEVANFIITDLGEDKTFCKSLAPIKISGNVEFGNATFKPTFKATDRNNNVGFVAPSNVKGRFDFTYTPIQADIDRGQVTLLLTVPKPNGSNTSCRNGIDEMVIFFKPDPTATIAGNATICSGTSSDITFTATPNTTITYNKNGGTNQTIGIGASGTATINSGPLTANTDYNLVSIKYADAPDCSKSVTGTATITVTPIPTASIGYTSSSFSKCIDTDQPVNLTGTGAYQNGAFSAPAGLSINSSTGSINPSSSTAGTYNVSYTTPASGGCDAVAVTTDVTIIELPTITLSYAGTPFCLDNTSSTLPSLGGTGNYQGGTYSAPSGLSITSGTGAIDISNSTPGTYTVTYSIIPSTGCAPITQTAGVVITEKPTPVIAYGAAEFCKSLSASQSVNLSGSGIISGGIYSSTPAGLNIDANGGINPSLSNPGNYTITYSLDAANGCEGASAETPISISDIPFAEISYAGPFCQSDTTAKTVSFSNTTGAYQNGTFSGTAGLDINATSGEIIPSSSQSGNHTVTYTIPASVGCAQIIITTPVTITATPQATIAYARPFCNSDTNTYTVTFSNTAGAYQNGVFSGTSGLSIASDGAITPSTSSAGPHTVTYTIPTENGCQEVVSTTDIEIFEKVLITTQPSNLGICSTQPASFSVVASGDNLTYQWFKDNAAISGATSASFNLNNATSTNAGDYHVVVSGSNSCSSDTSDTVTLNVDEEIIIIKPAEDETFCENDVTEITFEYIAHANGAPLTFEWIKVNNVITAGGNYTMTTSGPTGVTGEYSGKLIISNLTVADNGAYAVKIKGPDYFTCPDATSKSFTLSIKDQPDAPETTDISYCQGDVASALTATGTNLKWYATETGDDLITGTPTPSTTTVGTTSYWVSQSPLTCESPRAKLVVTINEKPAIPATTAALSFCLNEAVTTPLEAEGDAGNTINWYDAVDASTPLASAPVPNTSTDVTTYYWVSQTKDECESDRVQVTITINPLPILTADAANSIICSGSSTTLDAEGATSYLWTVDGTAIEAAESTKPSPTVSPTVTTTYLVTGTSDQGCTSTAEVTIEVEEKSVGGSIAGTTTVCTGTNSGTLSLSGHLGDVMEWQSSTNGTDWTSISNTSTTLNYSNLTETTEYIALVKNGTVCEPATSLSAVITIDQLPVGGELNFAGGLGNVYSLCDNATAGNNVPIELTGYIGTIIDWELSSTAGATWTSVNGTPHTSTTYNGYSNLTATTLFRAIIGNGVCGNVYSDLAIISIIPSNIKPSPVTASPTIVCLGEPVTLASDTGYGTIGNINDKGDFNSANSMTNNGWRVRRYGSTVDLDFPASGDNLRPDKWVNTNDHPFYTRTLSNVTPFQEYNQRYDSRDKKFAIVSGNNPSTMETPVFNTFAMDDLSLTYDQAYHLVNPEDRILVDISIDGGNTYNTILKEITGPSTSGNYDKFGIVNTPENQVKLDLSDYIGQTNLRIRFTYLGTIAGSIWAIDNIQVPDEPNKVTLEWRDNTLSDPGELIGTTDTVTWIPKYIGENIFEVTTFILTDDAGNGCTAQGNSETISVYAFDPYTSVATAETVGCGTKSININATITGLNQGEITAFPDGDDSTVKWEVISGPAGGTFVDMTSANTVFTPAVPGEYTLRWEIAKDTDSPCTPIHTDITFTIEDCTTLDFDGEDDFVDLGTDYTGTYSIEAWFRPEATTGTIISKRDENNGNGFDLGLNNGKIVFSWNAGVLTSPQNITANNRWYHAAVSFNGSNAELFIDGISVASHTGGAYLNGTASMIIGAKHDPAAPLTNKGNFSGWIEEVRIWNTVLTEKQIRFMMNQRLYNNGAQMGVEIPMDVPEGLTFNNLAGYYRLIATDILTGGLTADLASTAINGVLHNMETLQENTAPLPYTSRVDGQTWGTDDTWTYFDVWDAPNSNGVDGTPIEWNIVRTSHDIKSGGKDITILGLLSDTAGKMLSIADPGGAQDETNNGQFIRVTHYLLLDGNMDLVGESQLLQDEGSLLAEASAGYLERDQQGTLSSFNYNYWTAPVSTRGAANNSGFTVRNIMWDGTDSNNPKAINYQPGYPAADGAKTNPITKSDYWIFKFANKLTNDYDSWQHIGSTGFLKAGEGHTMKGASGVDGIAAIPQKQNYVYRGKPNNGDITLTIDKERNYLIGNPYPSALDATEFILDNLNSSTVSGARNNKNVFNGVIYFWDHFSGATHILREYIGGYATLNLIGGAPAISNDERVNANNAVGTKTPEQFIPVSQGFFVNTGTDESLSGGEVFTLDGGAITFKNSQRVFARESSGNSIFLRPENITKTGKEEIKSIIPKIRISFKSPKGYNRQLLVGADPNTTNGFDIGYDAPMIEYNLEDMYWLQGGNFLVIQGVPDFGKDQVLPLGVRIDQSGEFKIKIDTLENINENQTIYLRDIILDTIHDMRSEPYVSTSEAGEITNRFELIFYKESKQDPIIEDPVLIDDLTDISLLHSYTENEMMVLNPKELRISAIYLFDLNGKLLSVFDDVPCEKEIILKVANFSEGIYILKMHTDNEIVTRKIIMKN